MEVVYCRLDFFDNDHDNMLLGLYQRWINDTEAVKTADLIIWNSTVKIVTKIVAPILNVLN
ncbi:hypothetical protein MCBMB27_03689 [Methylobacterium phyllosphaerae]|uniref:Uncharacterized protein n=1 Tax=Methylobacterium phyllosphaerae TaxID=418223 RepID=A0AAE8L837_9HYPH|nr:hypothetical protein MCBMB27_03689 [Methylobacterium phyllosphaerae]SFH30178.1 hypothetical protein SAMN05192567_119113 [Methylobacterium phyllosphaerae]